MLNWFEVNRAITRSGGTWSLVSCPTHLVVGNCQRLHIKTFMTETPLKWSAYKYETFMSFSNAEKHTKILAYFHILEFISVI